MTLDEFWMLIHLSWAAASSHRERAEWLTGQLARLPASPIIEFELANTAPLR